MKNIKFWIEPETQEKILHKHGVAIGELWCALLHGRPRFRRVKNNIFITITHYFRYVTVFFEYEGQKGRIMTAYTSSKSQIKMYHKK